MKTDENEKEAVGSFKVIFIITKKNGTILIL